MTSMSRLLARRRTTDAGCWEWTGSTTRGYGTIRHEGRVAYVHRVAFGLANGTPPTDKKVCHRCDNPLCFNPDHLFLGTQAENMADMRAKGRSRNRPAAGEACRFARLTNDTVVAIRTRLRDGARQSSLARELGVSKSCVQGIASGRTWKHLTVAALVALVTTSSLALARARESDALLLARICVSEAGWRAHETGDCGAIAYTLIGTVEERGVSFRAAARAHSPRATGASPASDVRLAWVAQLDERGREPAAWPDAPHAPWSAYRARWLDVLDRSRELVTWSLADHERDSMCDVPPVTWAARWHTPSRGLVPVDCGDTANRFFARARPR